MSVFSTGRSGGSPNSWSKFKTRINAAIKEELGEPIQAWSYHDCRRSAATAFAEHGADRHLVSLLLDHTDGDITATYDRSPRFTEKLKILEWWSDRIAMHKLPPTENAIDFKRVAE